nr:DUF3592 domain-containing protein [uncultured Gimesia sp.]
MITLVAGIVTTVAGVWMFRVSLLDRGLRKKLLKNSVRVRGKIVRFESGTKQDAVTVETSTPVVEYQGRDGQTYELYLPSRLSSKPLTLGSPVPVFYEKGNPGNANEALRMWDVNLRCGICFMVLLFGLGLLFTHYQNTISVDSPPTESQPVDDR